MPWSPAPSSLLPDASTPCAMSVDWPWIRHLTAADLPMKIVLLVADLADRVARHLDQLLAGDRGRAADFAGEHHPIGGDQRLDAAARLRLGSEKGVDDRVGDAVANLVGMAFRHRFAGEHKIALGQGSLPFPKASKKRSGKPTAALMQSCAHLVERQGPSFVKRVSPELVERLALSLRKPARRRRRGPWRARTGGAAKRDRRSGNRR